MHDYDSTPYMNMLKMQQSLWQQWSDNMRSSTQQSAQPNDAFMPFFEAFKAASIPGAGGNPWAGFPQGQMPTPLWGGWQNQWTELCNGFTGLTQKFSEASGDSAVDAADWLPIFDATFARLKESFAHINAENSRQAANMCRLQFAGGMDGKTAPFMGAPKLGPLRLQQKALEEHLQKVTELAECSGKYVDYIGCIPGKALDLLREKLLQCAHEDKAITSVRELYDMWVGCMDAAAREVVFTEQYPKLYADVNNALLLVLDGSKKQMEAHNKSCGQPTKSAFDTLARRQHLQGRAIQLEVLPNLGHMHSEVKELRQQLQEALQKLTEQDWPGLVAAMEKKLDEHSQALADMAAQTKPSPKRSNKAAQSASGAAGNSNKVKHKR